MEYEQLVKTSGCSDMRLLWILRMLVPLEGHKSLLHEKDLRDDSVARAAGLGKYLHDADKPEEYNPKAALMLLRQNLECIESNADKLVAPNPGLRTSLASISNALGLNPVEEEILHFCVIVKQDEAMCNATDLLGTLTAGGVGRVIRTCLQLNDAAINEALSPSSKLSVSGLLSLDARSNFAFQQKVDLLDGLMDGLELGGESVISIFSDVFVKSQAAKLIPDDYPHLSSQMTTIGSYINNSAVEKTAGVNILLHGAPGTGKTEFVRMLACSLGLNLYEVATEGRNGAPHNGQQRFRSYRLGQMICASDEQTAILFDEAEDVFCQDKEDAKAPAKKKAWVNRLLEENPVPAFWITNDVSAIDPAFVRRFDVVLEMETPPRSVRERILNRYCEGLPVSPRWAKRIAEYEYLPPAVVERAASVAKAAQVQEKAEAVIEKILGGTMEAMGYPPLPLNADQEPLEFRLDVLNTDSDLPALCKGLQKSRRGKLCLYGPPGTGKTAFGKHVANLLDMPLMIRRASDILSPYVGQAEINMARMFRDAESEGAVLLLDEADSFLQDRQGAERSWEISSVNEMLTQMESYRGIFVASTNFMHVIDSAAMRRFTVRIKFGYMKPSQSELLFSQAFAGKVPDTEVDFDRGYVQQFFGQLDNLTPGDFAVAMEKVSLIFGAISPKLLLQELLQMSSSKNGGNAIKMGFA